MAFRAPEVALVTIDDHWRYTAVSAAAAKLLSMSRRQLLGQGVWALFPAVRGTPLGSLMRDVMLTRTAGEIRMPAATRPGQDVIARVVPDSSGGIRVAWRLVTRVTRDPSRRSMLGAIGYLLAHLPQVTA